MKKIVIVSSVIFLLFLALVTFSFLKISDKNIFPKKIVERKINQFDEFKKYMVFKGSFYADNIFNVYDESF